MERSQEVSVKRFGTYLRKVRERRRLSLDSVEEMSAGFPERITKSHLSRIENGLAVPTFGRLVALSRIYGVPITCLAERFEVDLHLERPAPFREVADATQAREEAARMILAGRYAEALSLFSSALDNTPQEDGADRSSLAQLRLGRIDCLVHLGRFETAKAETEELLGDTGLAVEERVIALQFFVICAFRLGRHTVAIMGLEHARRQLDQNDLPPRMRADLEAIAANVMIALGQPEEAVRRCGSALELYEAIPIPFEACRTRINLAVALIRAGRIEEAETHLEAALARAETSGYDRQKAMALSTLAELAFGRGDLESAEAHAMRSNAVSRPREYLPLVFRNCYYLWKVAVARGDRAAAAANERTLRAYVGRVEEPLPEVEAFRSGLEGGAA